MRLLSGAICRSSAAPRATPMPNSEVVAQTSARPRPSTFPASGPSRGIPTVRVRRYSATIARLPAMPTIKSVRLGQRSASGA